MFFRFITYNKFKFKKWKNLTTAEKVKACQKLENIEAKRLRRDAYKVVIRDLKNGIAGTCVSADKEILLDTDYFLNDDKRFELMGVLFHEGRHAYQFDEINEKKKHCILSKAYWWKRNFQGYVNVAESGNTISFYSMQPVERDADEYAVKRLKHFWFRFRKEADYISAYTWRKDELKRDIRIAKRQLGPFYKWKVARRMRKERKMEQAKKR